MSRELHQKAHANHRKCVLPAVCIKKVIYTQGEATRRVQEDDKIAATWRNLWKDIEQKIRQRHGKLIMNNEVHRRKRNVQTKIKKAKEALDKAKNDVKMLLDKMDLLACCDIFEHGGSCGQYCHHRAWRNQPNL